MSGVTAHRAVLALLLSLLCLGRTIANAKSESDSELGEDSGSVSGI